MWKTTLNGLRTRGVLVAAGVLVVALVAAPGARAASFVGLYDGSGVSGGQASLYASNFSWNGESYSAYSLANATWSLLSTDLNDPSLFDDGTVIDLGLSKDGMTFGYTLANADVQTFGTPDSNGRFQSVAVQWTSAGTITFASATGSDYLAPVPIPASILLLGSGLAGVAVIGRRRPKPEA